MEEARYDVFLGGAVVDYGHADGVAGWGFVGIFAPGVDLFVGWKQDREEEVVRLFV